MSSATIRGITFDIGADTTKFKKELNDVITHVNKTSQALKAVNKNLKFNPTSLDLLNDKQQLLRNRVKDAEAELKKWNELLKNMSSAGVDRTSKDFQNCVTKVSQAEASLKKARSELENFNVTGERLKGVGTKIAGVGEKVSSVGQKLMPVSAGLAGLGAAAIKTSVDFGKSMSRVQAVTGASDAQLQELQKTATEWGSKTKYSASECAQAMYEMGSAGWDSQHIISGLGAVLTGASAGNMELADASKIVTNAISAFGLTAEDSQHVVDVLAKTASASTTEVSDLGMAFTQCSGVAGALRFSVDDVSIALGLMANKGINSEKAGTALRNIMVNLTQSTGQVKGELDRLGVSALNSDGSVKPLRDTIGQLREKFSTMSDAQKESTAQMLAGKEGMAGLLAIVNSSPTDFNNMVMAIDQANGSAKTMSDTLENNTNGKLTTMKSALESVAITIGQQLEPALAPLIEGITQLANKFQSLTPEQQQFIIKTLAMLAALGPVLLAIGGLSKGFQGLTSLISFFMTPAGAVVGTIMLLAAAFLMAYQHSESFRNTINQLVSNIQEKFAEMQPQLETLKQSIIQFIGVVKPIWDTFWTIFGDVVSHAMQFIGIVFGDGSKVLTDILNIFTGLFSGNWSQMWDGMKNLLPDVLTLIKDVVKNAFQGLYDVINDLTGGALGRVTEHFQGMKEKIDENGGGIKGLVKTVFQFVHDWIEEKIEQAKQKAVEKFEQLKNRIREKVEAIKNTVEGKFEEVKHKITHPIEEAKEKVRTMIGNIEGFFSGANFKLPHIQLPHFRASGDFSLNPLSVPHFDVDWYAKAMDQPFVLDGAQIFGAMNGKALGGGEAGKEVVLGLSYLNSIIDKAVAKTATSRPSVVNNFTIVQQPNENANELANRVADIITKKMRHDKEAFG